jgi:hypothetical protein
MDPTDTITLRLPGMSAWAEGLTLAQAVAELASPASPRGLVATRDSDDEDCTLDVYHAAAEVRY